MPARPSAVVPDWVDDLSVVCALLRGSMVAESLVASSATTSVRSAGSVEASPVTCTWTAVATPEMNGSLPPALPDCGASKASTLDHSLQPEASKTLM